MQVKQLLAIWGIEVLLCILVQATLSAEDMPAAKNSKYIIVRMNFRQSVMHRLLSSITLLINVELLMH